MEDFFEFYKTLNANWGIITIMMVMSIFVAIFHTVIISGLYQKNIKPRWLMFALNPSLIGLAALAERNLGALVFIFLFLSVFVLGIFGMIYAAIRSGIESSKLKNEESIKSGKAPLPAWRKIIYIAGPLLFIGFVFTLGVAYFIIVFFIILPFLSSLKPNNEKSFYNLQRTLPTSNIRSVAMGLAEITGLVKTIEPVIAKIKEKVCTGFLYTIEDVSTDDDGKDSYSLTFSETVCNSFYVQDATGKIRVKTEDLEFIDFEIDERYESSKKRYTQYLLKDDMKVLLIGKAFLTDNNEPIFQKEEIKNVFGIATLQAVEDHNNMRPMLKSAGYFAYFWLILIALILLTPIRVRNNKLEIGKMDLGLPFLKSKPVESIDDFYDNVYDSEDQNNEVDSTQNADSAQITQ
ncbi:MAG: hypothetical protein ABIP95_04750 [Pelobium sp.]